MIHVYRGVECFLVLISVVEESVVDRFDVPAVKLFAEDARKKVMICEVEHIVSIVGLVR